MWRSRARTSRPTLPRGTSGGRPPSLASLGAFAPDQFENPANAEAHYATTGPEILADCDGRLDAFVACVGSGGTLGGTSRFLREKLPGVRIIGAMPERSECAGVHGGTVVEGIIEDLGDCAQPEVSPGTRS